MECPPPPTTQDSGPTLGWCIGTLVHGTMKPRAHAGKCVNDNRPPHQPFVIPLRFLMACSCIWLPFLQCWVKLHSSLSQSNSVCRRLGSGHALLFRFVIPSWVGDVILALSQNCHPIVVCTPASPKGPKTGSSGQYRVLGSRWGLTDVWKPPTPCGSTPKKCPQNPELGRPAQDTAIFLFQAVSSPGSSGWYGVLSVCWV